MNKYLFVLFLGFSFGVLFRSEASDVSNKHKGILNVKQQIKIALVPTSNALNLNKIHSKTAFNKLPLTLKEMVAIKKIILFDDQICPIQPDSMQKVAHTNISALLSESCWKCTGPNLLSSSSSISE